MSLARSVFIATLSLTALAGTAAGASAQTYHQTQHCQVQTQGHQGHRRNGRFAKERAQIRTELREHKISKEQARTERQQIRAERQQMREARLERGGQNGGQNRYSAPGGAHDGYGAPGGYGAPDRQDNYGGSR